MFSFWVFILFYKRQKDPTVGLIIEKGIWNFFSLVLAILESERELNWLSCFLEKI